MQSKFKSFIYAIIIMVVIFWISTVLNSCSSCNKSSDTVIVPAHEYENLQKKSDSLNRVLEVNKDISTRLSSLETNLDSVIQTYEEELIKLNMSYRSALSSMNQIDQGYDKKLQALEVFPDSVIMYLQGRYDPLRLEPLEGFDNLILGSESVTYKFN